MGPFFIFSWFLDGFRFLFPQFPMVAVSYFFHIFFRTAQVHLDSNKSWCFYWLQHCYCLIWMHFFFFLLAFWHLFGSFSSNAIHFLVVNKKTVSYFEKFNGLLFLMIEEFDGSFLIRAFLIERECVYHYSKIFVFWLRDFKIWLQPCFLEPVFGSKMSS